jgi:mxaJ protein
MHCNIRTKKVNRCRRFFATLSVAGFLALPFSAWAADEAQEEKVLRVCQDPNNLPFSHRNLSGFENKIAELFAKDLGWKIEYTWYPQRMGFIRNTLKGKEPNSERFKCDLVTSVASGFDLGLATKPYYRSTYSMAYVKDRGLDEIKSPDDLLKLNAEKRKKLRIGVFARSPAVDWLLKNDLVEQMVPFQPQTGDPEQYPGEIIEKELAAGNIDVAIAWGPITGYFAKKSSVPMVTVPFTSTPENPVQFSIAMGVRYGEKAFKEQIDKLIEKNQAKIQAILAEYGVPVVNEPASAAPG